MRCWIWTVSHDSVLYSHPLSEELLVITSNSMEKMQCSLRLQNNKYTQQCVNLKEKQLNQNLLESMRESAGEIFIQAAVYLISSTLCNWCQQTSAYHRQNTTTRKSPGFGKLNIFGNSLEGKWSNMFRHFLVDWMVCCGLKASGGLEEVQQTI